jgi:hypothetical protein
MICSTNSGMMREYYKREIFYSLEKRERKREREREREKRKNGVEPTSYVFSLKL